MKTTFYTIAEHRPDFIALQVESLRRNMRSEWELVVLDNSDTTMIRSFSDQAGVKCIDIPPEGKNHSTANWALAVPTQWLWDTIIMRDMPECACIIDSDMFLLKPFDVGAFMGDSAIAGVPQSRLHVHYLWTGLIFFRPALLPEPRTIKLRCSNIDGQPVDVGGELHHYFKAQPEITPLEMSQREIGDPQYWMQLVADAWLHYRCGSNWDHRTPEWHAAKTKHLRELLA